MQTLINLWQLFKQPAVLAICAVVFIADVMAGFVVPTLPLYATSLGASVALVGALTAVVSLVAIFAALPIGVWSDAQGRKRVIVIGMLIFVLSCVLYTLAPNAYWLLPARMLAGIAALCVFSVSTAYVGDVVRRGQRGLVIGLYSAAMGLGFAIGPAVGGVIAERAGYRVSYLVAAAIGLVGCWVAWRYLAAERAPEPIGQGHGRRSVLVNVRLLLQDPNLLTACLGNFCINALFSTTFSFLPLYADGLALNKAAVGSLFAARALASTLTRIPTGILTTYIAPRKLMVAGLLLSALVMLLVAGTVNPLMLAGVLALEGIAYGLFLTAGQADLAESAAEETRGAAIGVYGMAGSVGGAFSPLALGLVAEVWGLPPVFVITALLLFVGGVGLWWRSLARPAAALLKREVSS